MPDDRLFHKRLGHSEKVGHLTDFEYIVWQAYVLSADDFGVMRFTAVALQADHDRLSEKPPRLVQKAFASVAGAGLIRTFDHQGQVYCYQHNWQEWQHIDYPRATINPKPSMESCSEATRKLFEAHPGGWRGKKARNLPEHLPKPSGTPSEGFDTPSAIPSKTFDTPSGTPDRKPLAVSRQPLAVSRQPLTADARSNRPIFVSERFTVFEWQFDELSKILGPHFEGFRIDEFFDALGRQATADGLVLPKAERWEWLQAQVLSEAQKRGLPMASSTPPVRDKAAENRAMDERLLAEIQEDRRLRAGR